MTLEILLGHPAVQALGRALLHFIWQGALLAVLLCVVKTVAPPSAARLRYAAASLIMLMMPIALVVTIAQDLSHPVLHDATKVVPVNRLAANTPVQLPQLVLDAPTSKALRPGIPGWVVCIWMLGVLLLSVRAAYGWVGVQKLKDGAAPPSPELEDLVRRLKLRLRVSAPVRLCMSAVVRVPAAIGWLRPCVLLPVTAVTGLDESQIRALVAHELAHIRRHDYLVNLLQTLIETVLFYHPAVWWVGKQMRLEREHCCDDIAVAACGNAFQYASALAEMEQIRDGIPEPALAATGGDLLARIRRLLGRQDDVSRSLGPIAAAALVLIIASATAFVSLHAAPQDPQPAFEVASIKPDVGGGPGPQFFMFPGFTVRRATLKDLVLMAYGVRDFQLSGGPGWINSDRYSIEAKVDGNPTMSPTYHTLQSRRLQTLLQDRFKLAVHRETKELPVYHLTVAKGGLKLQPLKEGGCITGDPTNPAPAPGKNRMDYCGFIGFETRGLFKASSGSMAQVANWLALPLGRTVVDKTGISGQFRIELTFTPLASTADAEPPADAPPDIFTAIQEQLGLKLESTKGPVEVLVIDHVEKPSEN